MLSLLDLARRMDAGTLSPEGALRLASDAIAARDPAILAFAARPPALRAGAAGPLKGIAVGVKDIIDTADLPTEHGSPLYAGWRPRADAAVVAALRAAGGTVAGKTATTPFAYLDPAATRNPHDPGHSPGGSSSGSAAAVAAGMVALALGTQTGGSVIRPASFCGIVGVKPSYRLLPTVGIKTFSWTLDTPGVFAASVADAAYGLAALTGRRSLRIDGRSGDGTPRFGVVTQGFAGAPDPEGAAALDAAVRAVEGAGARAVALDLPPTLAAAHAAHPVLQDYEARQALAWEFAAHRDALPPRLSAMLAAAQGIAPEAYDDARRTAHRARAALKGVFDGVDALLTLAAPGAAPATLASTGDARFNRLWTLLGVPCVAVPASRSGTGLPVAVQVVAPFGRDEEALLAARFVETALVATV